VHTLADKDHNSIQGPPIPGARLARRLKRHIHFTNLPLLSFIRIEPGTSQAAIENYESISMNSFP
jgi:hypothetical protein